MLCSVTRPDAVAAQLRRVLRPDGVLLVLEHCRSGHWLGPVRVRPLSRIDAPADRARVAAGPVDVVGVAWAPPGGVSAVDVAVEDQPWIPAELAAELAPASWRRWRARLALPPGVHTLRVRCTARTGAVVQDPAPRPPFPTGVTGHHSITVRSR